jgi:hypothetical protein
MLAKRKMPNPNLHFGHLEAQDPFALEKWELTAWMVHPQPRRRRSLPGYLHKLQIRSSDFDMAAVSMIDNLSVFLFFVKPSSQ